MYYIYCGAYKALLMALYFKNVLGEKITIVSNNEDVIKYCNSEKIYCIQYEFVRPTIPSFKSFYDLLKLRKILDSIIEKIKLGKNDCFILTAKAISYESFYMAKELAKKGDVKTKIIHRDFKIFKHPRFKPIFIRGDIFRVLIKIVLDLKLMYYESNKDPRYGIDNNFLNKYDITNFDLDLDTEKMILEAVKKSKSSYKEYENLIIDSGPIVNIVTFDSMKKLYKNLFELPIDFAFKKHPNPISKMNQTESSFYELFKNCSELPDYIPVEMYYNSIKKNVIALFSASLITASEFKHLRAISLLELIDWHHESYKTEFKNHLIKQSKNKIIFPNNFKELKEILLNS